MKLKLNQFYNSKNEQGDELEILGIWRNGRFVSSGVGVLVVLNGRKKPSWLTLDWFLSDQQKAPNES